MDAGTSGIGEQPHSCGEMDCDLDQEKAEAYANENGIELHRG